jgi:hypothetical protein
MKKKRTPQDAQGSMCQTNAAEIEWYLLDEVLCVAPAEMTTHSWLTLASSKTISHTQQQGGTVGQASLLIPKCSLKKLRWANPQAGGPHLALKQHVQCQVLLH